MARNFRELEAEMTPERIARSDARVRELVAEMEDQMVYKGYRGSIESEAGDGTLHGHVKGIRDIVHYEADTLPQLFEEFCISLDDYLDMCREAGKEPNRPTEA